MSPVAARGRMVELTDVKERFCEAAGCDSLYRVIDRDAGLHAYLALHDLSRGPAYGGIRRRVYASPQAAVREVVWLAEAMTIKTAFAGLPAGGGKGVMLWPDGAAASEAALAPAYRALGVAIEALTGVFYAGPDVGTGEAELAALRETTQWVSTIEAKPGHSTAIGVLAGCRAAIASTHLDPRGKTAAVIGVGSVGREVARGLRDMGFELLVSDILASRAEAAAAEVDGRVVAPEIMPEADLLVPCALGPFVTLNNISQLRCKIICGSANYQLEVSTLAHELAERQILYVPDFAVNAGGVIEGVLRRAEGPDGIEAKVDAALASIGTRVETMLALAAQNDMTPLEAALTMIEEG